MQLHCISLDNIITSHPLAMGWSGFSYSTPSRLSAAWVVHSTSLYSKYIQYIFRPNWTSSIIQVGLIRQLLLPRVLALKPCMCLVLRFCLPNFSLVSACISFRCVHLLNQMHAAWWSACEMGFRYTGVSYTAIQSSPRFSALDSN
jgi:hypothetical protein